MFILGIVTRVALMNRCIGLRFCSMVACQLGLRFLERPAFFIKRKQIEETRRVFNSNFNWVLKVWRVSANINKSCIKNPIGNILIFLMVFVNAFVRILDRPGPFYWQALRFGSIVAVV